MDKEAKKVAVEWRGYHEAAFASIDNFRKVNGSDPVKIPTPADPRFASSSAVETLHRRHHRRRRRPPSGPPGRPVGLLLLLSAHPGKVMKQFKQYRASLLSLTLLLTVALCVRKKICPFSTFFDVKSI
jgi:hypothetical protein